MKIQKISLNNMRNAEHFQFHTEFCVLMRKHEAGALKVEQQFDAYLPLYADADEVLKKILKSAITEKIQNADKQRDSIFRGMVDTNKAALKHFNPQVQEAAKRLKIVFDTYGNLAQKPLNEQTAGVYNLLQDPNGKYLAEMNEAGIAKWAEELAACNEIVAGLKRDRYDEVAARSDIVLKQARVKVDDAYRTITERINALVIVEGAAEYSKFIETLNTIISKYAAIMAQRKPIKN
jgi:hypothetical protein